MIDIISKYWRTHTKYKETSAYNKNCRFCDCKMLCLTKPTRHHNNRMFVCEKCNCQYLFNWGRLKSIMFSYLNKKLINDFDIEIGKQTFNKQTIRTFQSNSFQLKNDEVVNLENWQSYYDKITKLLIL